MTIRRGEAWGSAVSRPDDLVLLGSDAELADALARREGPDDHPAWGLTGGDLHRSLGAPGVREEMQRLPVDAIGVVIDDTHHLAIAHVVARRSWWRGPIIAVMNVDHLGPWNVAPRAHPNDGRLDVVEVAPAMSLRSRWQARSRLPSGAHVPHPAIRTRQVTAESWDFERPLRVWIDGLERGTACHLEVIVHPDACYVHV